jgi:hypothetical protein
MAACVLMAGQAKADTFAVNLVADTDLSTLDLTLSATLLGTDSDSDTAVVSGDIDVIIDQDGIVPPAQSVEFTGGNLGLSDLSLGLSLAGGFISLDVNSMSLGATVGTGGPFATNGLNPGTFDAGGLTLNLDAGSLDITGTITSAIDLDADPIEFDIPTGTIATIEEVDMGGGTYDVTITLPVSVTTAIVITSPLAGTIGIDLSGDLVFKGQKIVPEPSTLVLAGFGLAAVVALARRRRK